jgi:DNA-binding SARP family transcriptional activator
MLADGGTRASAGSALAVSDHDDHDDESVVRLRVLSGFEVWVGDQHVPVTSNVERLLGLLAVRRRPLARLTVASTLWMDTTEDRAAANLRTALWKARQTVDGCIDVAGNHIALARDVDVDLSTVVATTHRLLDDEAELCQDDLDTTLLTGELLPGWDEEWILFERERLRQLCIHALESLCRKLSAAGKGGRAVDAGLAAVAAEPLRESAQRALIAAHLAEGNVVEGRRQYQGYRALLWDALGIEPSDALRSLVGLRRDALVTG